MDHYKSIIVFVVMTNSGRYFHLIFNSDVAGVDEVVEFEAAEADVVVVSGQGSDERLFVQAELLSLLRTVETVSLLQPLI